jgi:hypothetical protein
MTRLENNFFLHYIERLISLYNLSLKKVQQPSVPIGPLAVTFINQHQAGTSEHWILDF